MPQWTDEQLSAITTVDTNILLSAAAGSGKTTVLVERVIRMLRNGADIDRMLIVTFTRAASADMREKLSKAIAELAKTDATFRRQQLLLERASISTLHSFCSDFLRTNFEAAGVDPSYRLVGDTELNDMTENAMDKAMEEAYENMTPGLDLLTCGRGPKGVREMALALLEAMNDQPEPEAWLDRMCAQDDELRRLWTDELVLQAHSCIEHALKLMTSALKDHSCNINYATAIEADIAELTPLLSDSYMDYDMLQRALSDFKSAPVGKKRAGVEPANDFVKDTLKAAREEIKKITLRDFPLAPALNDADAIVPALRALADIVLRAREILTERKRELAVMNFNDLEHFTIRALKDENTAAQIRAQYDHIFLDEYQDTSNLQEYIISRICRENNVFMVGDVKQSIYRFRRADPSLFRTKYDAYAGSNGGTLLHLTRNFRSCPAVLDFVNRVFENCMTGGNSEIVYDANARLNHGNIALTGGHVELNILKKVKDNDATEAFSANIEEGDPVQEAVFAAKRIRELMEADKTLTLRDFAILSRDGKGVLARMAMTLIALGIPAYAEGAEAYYESMEVRLAMALLKLVKNRRNDVELIGVLHSPVVGLSVNDLALIRVAYPEYAFCDAVYHYAKEKEDAIATRLNRFYADLDRWRDLSRCAGLGFFAHTLFTQSGLYNIARVLPAARQRIANIDRIINDADAFDRTVSGSLTAFLSNMEHRRLRNEIGSVSTLSENDDVVRLMTVHKSKGLEFRVVIGVSLAKRPSSREKRDALTVHNELGLSTMYIDRELRSRRKTLCRLAVNARLERENSAEQLRVLYVMLTRAKEQLILVGTASDPEKLINTPRAALSQHSYLNIILAALPDTSDPLCPINVFDEPVTVEMPETAQNDHAIEEDPEITEAIRWVDPNAADSLRPMKLTVSGILRQLQTPSGFERLESRPRFMMTSPGKLTATEIGTAYHRVLQCMDLAAISAHVERGLRDEIARQIQALVDANRMLPVQAAAVKPKLIVEFYRSDLGRRMLASTQVQREWSFNANMDIPSVLDREECGPWNSGLIMVQGTIDACFIENGAWILLDYKTNRETDPEALTERYADQLRMYAHALTASTGIEVAEIQLCLLASNEAIRIEL